MTVSKTGFEAATGTYSTNGAAIPAGSGETATSAGITNTSTLVTDTSVKSSGAQSIRVQQAASSLAFVKTAAGLGVASAACDVEFLQTGLTGNKPPSGSEFYLVQARGASNVNLYSLTWLTTGFLRVRTSGSNNLWTSTAAFVPSVFQRVSMAVRIDTTTPANSQFRVAVFAVGSDTPISGLDSGWVTAAPQTTGVAVDSFYAGRCNGDADTTPAWIDNLRWDPAASDLLTAAGVTATLTGVVTPSAHTVGTLQTLTLTPSGFTPTSYSGTWDGVAWGPQASNVVTHTDDSSRAGQTIPWTATGTA